MKIKNVIKVVLKRHFLQIASQNPKRGVSFYCAIDISQDGEKNWKVSNKSQQ